jgi:hypothetical protein
MQVRTTLGRVAAITGILLAASAATSLPAQAAAPAAPVPAAVAATNTVGPFTTWEACDYERRVMQTRYGKKTYPCFLHTNGYYYFKYEA